VYENESYDNTGGILVFVLPGDMTNGMGSANIHHNNVHSNNRMNFCHPGAVVCGVPQGMGMMVMAAKHTSIHDNAIADNDGVGILVVDYRSSGSGPVPMGFDPTTSDVCIHDNTFTNNSTMPVGLLQAFEDTMGRGPDVLWDGDFDAPSGMDCTDNSRVHLCLPSAGNQGVRFTCGDGPGMYMHQLSNIDAHNCACTDVPCITSF
jgi:parallel beta-helix repeat protein